MPSRQTVRQRDSRPRRALWRLAIAACIALVVLVALATALRLSFHGERLAAFIEDTLGERIRGEVAVGSVDWSLPDLPAALASGWLPVVVRDVEVKDEYGTVVLLAKTATAEVHLYDLAAGPDFRFRDIVVEPGGYALIRQVPEPFPVHAQDTSAVSLASAFYPERSKSFSAGISAASSAMFDLQSFEVRDATLEFDFGDRFRARAEGVTGSGSLLRDPRDPLIAKLYYTLSPTVRRASLSFGPVDLQLENVEVERLAQIAESWPGDSTPSSLRWTAKAQSMEGARFAIEGAMLDHWHTLDGGDYAISVSTESAGPLIDRLTGSVGGGAELGLDLRLEGPRIAPTVAIRVENFELVPQVGDARLPVLIESANARFHLATESGEIEDTVARVGGGQVHLSADLSLNPMTFSVDLDIPEPVDVGPLLPEDRALSLLGDTKLSGSMHAFGSSQMQEIDRLDLQLGHLGVKGRVVRRPDNHVEVERLGLDLGRTHIAVTGDVYGDDGIYDLSIQGSSADARRWLRAFGAPELASRVDGNAHLTGTFSNPTVTAAVNLGGVPIVDRARTQLSYRDDELRVERARTSAFGGSVDASAQIGLSPRPVIRRARAEGRAIELSKLPVVGAALTGHGDLEVSASGRPSSPSARATLALKDWTLAGDAYEDTTLSASSDGDGSLGLEAHLARKLGGQLDLSAVADGLGRLSGALSIRALPVQTLQVVRKDGEPASFGAGVDAELRLAGTTRAPLVEGQLGLEGAWYESAFLGGAKVELVPDDMGRLSFSGRFFQSVARIRGTIDPRPPFAVEIEADLRRFELDRLWPELRDKLSSRSWISGKVAYRSTLLPVPGKKPEMDLELTEAVLIVDSENARGRPAPVRLRNRTPLSVSVVGDQFQLRHSVVVEGPAGELMLSGGGSRSALDLRVDGAVSVELLEPYVREQFEELGGELLIAANVSGALEAPRFTGSLSMRDIEIKPSGQDAIVSVPRGKIEFTNDQLSLTGISMVVLDAYSSDKSELHISGGVKLVDFEPREWAVHIDGQLAGKMLLVVAPDVFSAAGGVAELSIALLGSGLTPDIDGSIEFASQNPLTLVPRGLRRELTFTEGSLSFTEQLVELDRVRGWFDDEGRITDISGEISLRNWRPTDIDVAISAREVPYRVPQELDLAVNLSGLRVLGDFDSGLEIWGRVEIVDGRYIQRWKQALDYIKPARSVESGPSILDTEPLIANAKLNLQVFSRALFVRNNIANLELSGDLTITGTPAEPRLDGLVRVQQGTFKIQGIRPTFTRTSGTLWFSRLKDFPEQTPELNVRSESDFRALNGQNHLIIFELNGPLSNIQWDLKTSAGLNKAQTMNLFFLGRTFDETRAALGDEPVARVGEFNDLRTTDQIDSGALVLADELAKAATSDILSSLVADPIRNITNIDVIRLGIGATGSFNLYLEENFTRSVRGIGEYERSSRGSTLQGRVQYRVTDRISGDGEYLRKQFDDDAQVDIDRWRVKFTYQLPIIP